jgi:hypothetical protein
VVGATAGPTDDLESATGWTVNPDGNDTATTGRWELGTPERSDAFEFVVQPGRPGRAPRLRHRRGQGRERLGERRERPVARLTTLQSPPFSLAG